MNQVPETRNEPLSASGVDPAEDVCRRFQSACQAEQQPRIEDFLAQAPPAARAALLGKLLVLEFAQRSQRGETLVLEAYGQRFPNDAHLITAAFREAMGASGSPAPKADSAPNALADTNPERARARAASDPTQLGRFQITGKLGTGGFGVVYKGYDADLRRHVAIKVAHLERLARSEDAEAYLAEARMLAQLDHPGIVPVYEVGRTDDGTCYLVSKFLEGRDLQARIEESRPSFAEAVEILARVAEALHHAHQQGVVHRDIKPANILLDAKGNPIVVDFGLALREEEFGKETGLAGTPQYMSPEQARGEGHLVDARSDVYSLGVVLYELLTGQRPFRADSLQEMLEQILTREPRPPRQLDDTIPKELDRICLKALAKRASERYSTAADLADDLRHWQASPAAASGAATGSGSTAGRLAPGEATTATPEFPRASLKVVPRGLRSFDASDADFFLELLPGARDRDGLPESLRFWKQRLEETDPDQTFRVGLLYGPSGCGKSSLVKAGLLPRLTEQVLVVYVEATPQETESRLLKGLRKRCAGLPENLNLVDTLAQLRRGRGLPAGKKVLLVLDQFEQWLHAQRNQPNTELLQALRQCDGQHVQGLLLVRDDFWLAVRRFLHELEIPPLEGHNTALVDLFDLLHARKVLGLFGSAYGRLPENPAQRTPEQERFLSQAVAELAQDGKVISVRLSLLAEMIKGRAWIPATLKEVGGAEGVRVAFLEEKFSASSASSEYRLHQKAARGVLKALLPEQGSDIKGHMRSYQELLVASGYGPRPKDFEALLRILDADLRLLTPTDPEGIPAEDKEPTPAASDVQYYQLTHDYLVPGLRQWLTRKQRETRRGRAELRLAERAAQWHAKPENRQLPAWWEWANIHLFTRQRDWTPPQRKMMRQAGRYHGWHGLALAVLLTVATVVGFEIQRRVVADRNQHVATGLVARLCDAEVGQVPAIVSELGPYRTWADPQLVARLEDAQCSPKERLHLQLALLPVDAEQVQPLQEALLRSGTPPAEVLVLREALRPHQEQLVSSLWERLEDARENPERRFRAGCALALYDPDSPRWEGTASLLVDQLVAQNPVFLGGWSEALRPVRRKLLEPLGRVFRDKDKPTERTLATNLLADYAADQPETLAELVKDADPKQYAVLWPRILEHREQTVVRMKQELTKTAASQWNDPPLNPAWATLDPALVGQITGAHGVVAERFAWCQTLPLEQFTALAEGLRRSGFQPLRFRPYTPGKEVQVAAVWTRDGRDWQMAHGLSADEVRQQDAGWRAKGYIPADVAGYRTGPDATEAAERYAALWIKPAERGEDARLYVGVPESQHRVAGWEPLKQAGYVPRTYHALLGADGQQRYSCVWGKTATNPAYTDTFASDEMAYEGLLAANPFPVDICVRPSRPPASSATRYTEQLAQADKDLQAKPGDLNARLRRGQALTGLSRDMEAVTELTAVLDKAPKTAAAYRYRAVAQARLGKADEARKDLAEFMKQSSSASQKAYLDALIAAYLGEDVEGLKRLDDALRQHSKESGFLYDAACAYAVAAQAISGMKEGTAPPETAPGRAKVYGERALTLLQEAVACGYSNYAHMETDADLDGLRSLPGFVALLSKGNLDRRYAAIWYRSPVLVGQETHGLDPAGQVQRGRELAAQGYRPAAISVAWLGENKPRATTVVWHRPVVPESVKDSLAKRQAQAAVVLLQLGQEESVWPLLQHSPDPRRRTYLIHSLSPLGTDARLLTQRLEAETDVSARRALIRSLGEFSAVQLPEEVREPLVERLLRWYRDDPDPGIHGAIDWLLRHGKEGDTARALDWGQAEALGRIDQERTGRLAEGRRWSLNTQGQTFALFPGPVEFLMGSPESEPGRRDDETLHRRRIDRSFALATKPVTIRQFQLFLKAHPEVRHNYTKQYSPDPDGPIVGVTWYEAAQYCRWLSDQEGVPEEQMCYPSVAVIEKSKDGVTPLELPADYLSRTGYRLPSEAEWEYACRAAAETSRYYGAADELLGAYAWYLGNAKERAWPVGQKRPNDFGLFDMHGNVWQWCQEGARPYQPGPSGQSAKDIEDIRDIVDKLSRALRGGTFNYHPSLVRAPCRYGNRPSIRGNSVGLRPARTYR